MLGEGGWAHCVPTQETGLLAPLCHPLAGDIGQLNSPSCASLSLRVKWAGSSTYPARWM